MTTITNKFNENNWIKIKLYLKHNLKTKTHTRIALVRIAVDIYSLSVPISISMIHLCDSHSWIGSSLRCKKMNVPVRNVHYGHHNVLALCLGPWRCLWNQLKKQTNIVRKISLVIWLLKKKTGRRNLETFRSESVFKIDV